MLNLQKCRFVKSAPKKEFFLTDRKQVVFLGRSNVGKSSLLNATVNSRLAEVSKLPGRTQMLNYYDLSDKYYLVDAPGYGFFYDSSLDFEEMMDDYLSLGRRLIRRAYLFLDARRGLSEDDAKVLNLLKDKGLSARLVITKLDKLNTTEKNRLTKELTEAFPSSKVIMTSASKRNGIDILQRDISDALTE